MTDYQLLKVLIFILLVTFEIKRNYLKFVN
jgi:hypothetical protein